MDFLSLLVHLKEVCLKIVFTWLGHIDLDSSAENNLASMEGLDDLKEVGERDEALFATVQKLLNVITLFFIHYAKREIE